MALFPSFPFTNMLSVYTRSRDKNPYLYIHLRSELERSMGKLVRGVQATRRRRTRRQPKLQINLRIDRHFLSRIDEAAIQDCTTRSELIRTAIQWYLIPQNRSLEQNDQDYIFETIKHRRAVASSNRWFKEHGHEIDVYDS